MLTLMLLLVCQQEFGNEILVPNYGHWSIDQYGERLYCAKWGQPVTVAELTPGQTEPRVITQVDGSLHDFRVSRHGRWAAVIGDRLVLFRLDRPDEKHAFQMAVTGMVFVDDGNPMKALVTTEDGDVSLISISASKVEKVKLRGSLTRPHISGQALLSANGEMFFLPNQGQVIDLHQLSVKATEVKLPVLTVYDRCSDATQLGDFIRSDSNYVPGTTHITIQSNVLMKGHIDPQGRIEEHVAYKTKDRIYKCVLTVDNVAWLQAESWNEDFHGIRLKRVRLH